MILTLTVNPALDKSTVVDRLIPEKKLRAGQMTLEAGGGGINVSKALKELGCDSLALFPAGGLTGDTFRRCVEKLGLTHRYLPIQGETRESITVFETSTRAQYRFVLPGPEILQEEEERLLQMAAETNPSIIVASGSLAPGVQEDFIARIAALARRKGARLIADTSGKPLQAALEVGVYLLKPNLNELASLAGADKLELNEVKDAARALISRGQCEVIVVSLGPSGAILVTAHETVTVPAPVVKKQSTVGAGDSMVAGMAFMLHRNESLTQMVRFGVACGTAATMNPGSQLFTQADVYRLYEWIGAHDANG